MRYWSLSYTFIINSPFSRPSQPFRRTLGRSAPNPKITKRYYDITHLADVGERAMPSSPTGATPPPPVMPLVGRLVKAPRNGSARRNVQKRQQWAETQAAKKKKRSTTLTSTSPTPTPTPTPKRTRHNATVEHMRNPWGRAGRRATLTSDPIKRHDRQKSKMQRFSFKTPTRRRSKGRPYRYYCNSVRRYGLRSTVFAVALVFFFLPSRARRRPQKQRAEMNRVPLGQQKISRRKQVVRSRESQHLFVFVF